MKNQKFSVKNRLKSFKYAFSGLKTLVTEEHNSWIHILAAIIAITAGFLTKINLYEWVAVIFVIGFVITLEIINSAIENLADFVSPDKHDKIKKIKDLSAAGVLIAAITALITGLIIFIPKITDLC